MVSAAHAILLGEAQICVAGGMENMSQAPHVVHGLRTGVRFGTHPPMDQRTENQIMAAGRPVEVLATDDHVAHMAEIERFQRSQAFEQLPTWAIGLIAAHLQQHQLLLQQAAAQGGPLPGGGGQANNIPTGITQAGGSDLNALEGGFQ